MQKRQTQALHRVLVAYFVAYFANHKILLLNLKFGADRYLFRIPGFVSPSMHRSTQVKMTQFTSRVNETGF